MRWTGKKRMPSFHRTGLTWREGSPHGDWLAVIIHLEEWFLESGGAARV